MIETKRLFIIPANHEMNQLIIEDKTKFYEKFHIRTLPDWPNHEIYDTFSQLLEKDEDLIGWLNWFIVDKKSQTVIGDIGFKGKPVNAQVEIGYSMIKAFRNQGYVKEAIGALISYVRAYDVKTVIATTLEDNLPSIHVLLHHGFHQVDTYQEDGKTYLIWHRIIEE